MKVLISAGSKHGSTEEIAERMQEALRDQGVDADLRPPESVIWLDKYDAVILGSAVYAGRWRQDVRSLVGRLEAGLRSRPVWLFSSGPLGNPPTPKGDPEDAALIVRVTGAREHRVFAGKLDKTKLNVLERSAVRAVKAPYGDFRDWDEIYGWAVTIAEELSTLKRDVARV